MRHLYRSYYRRLANLMPYLVDSRTGIVRYLEEMPIAPGAPDLVHYHSLASDTGAFAPYKNFYIGGGASRDRGSALAKAVGEAVERYCSSIFWPQDFPLSTYEEADFKCVDPLTFTLYHPSQFDNPRFPFVPFEHDTLTRWSCGKNLVTGEPTHLPAARVWVPYVYDPQTAEAPTAQPISTGLALHCSYEEAVISGLCEVIERDTFMITWLANLAPPQIRHASLPPYLAEIVEQFTKTGAELTLFDISLDHGVPSVLSAYRHADSSNPAFAVAASCAPTAFEALLKSLEELDHTRHWASTLKKSMSPLPEGDPEDIIHGQSTHLRYWCEQSNLSNADFLFRSEKRIDLQDMVELDTDTPRATLDAMVERITANGGNPYAVDVTSEDVAPLGLVAVRAVVPEFHPLFSGHTIRSLGGTRLWTVPQKLGYRGVETVADTNSAAHPYP